MIETMLSAFQQQYKTMPEVSIKAPGRINIIGDHTDYNLGFVLPAAIDKYTYFVCSKNQSDNVSITSVDFEQTHDFKLNITEVQSNNWSKYIEAIVLVLKKNDYQFRGFDMLIAGNIPIGAGLSSSASLTCGIIFCINELYELHISKKCIALLAQETEIMIGLNCGLMDQYAILESKAAHCLFLDCLDLSFEFLPADFKGAAVVLINSNIQHDLAESEYNHRRQDVESALKKLQAFNPEVVSPRDVNITLLEQASEYLNATEFKRFLFVLEENQRVLDACNALKLGDMTKMGNLMNASHSGLSNQYEVSCPELDFLSAFAQKKAYVLGSRMMGGGFGGCTINLVKKGFEHQLIDEVTVAYKVKTGIEPTAIMLGIGEGIRRL